MGSPPPTDAPAPSADDVVDIVPPKFSAKAITPCSFQFALSLPTLRIALPSIFPLPIPKLVLKLTLTCQLPNPVDVSADLTADQKAFGGGRPVTSNADPDDNDESN